VGLGRRFAVSISHSEPKLFLGLLQVTDFSVFVAQVVVRLGIIRSEPYRLFVSLNLFGVAA
jgi:hypothetical protein